MVSKESLFGAIIALTDQNFRSTWSPGQMPDLDVGSWWWRMARSSSRNQARRSRAALRSKSRRTTFVRPEMPKQSSGELWGSHGVKEGGVGLSLIPPMHPEAPLGLLQVAFPAAGMLFCPGMTGSSELHAPCGQLYARQECVWMRRAVQGMCWTAPRRIGRLAVPSGGLIARPA